MPEPTEELIQRFNNTANELRTHALNHNRDPESVRLVAVSKRHTAESIVTVAGLGQKDFAENYLQEALDKQERVTIQPKECPTKERVDSGGIFFSIKSLSCSARTSSGYFLELYP